MCFLTPTPFLPATEEEGLGQKEEELGWGGPCLSYMAAPPKPGGIILNNSVNFSLQKEFLSDPPPPS
jgi:hypothetical protein